MGVAGVTLGSGDPLGDGSPEGSGDDEADDPDGDGSGAGVGTGGEPHSHSGLVGFAPVGVVRIGVAFRCAVGSPVTGSVTAGPGAVAPVVAIPATRGAIAGPCPMPAYGANVAVAAGPGVTVPAAASRFISDPSPFTTPRYAPAAPTTVSSPNAVTATARRRGRAGSGADWAYVIEPPNVFIPVEVTSGPPGGGSTGRRPMS